MARLLHFATWKLFIQHWENSAKIMRNNGCIEVFNNISRYWSCQNADERNRLSHIEAECKKFIFNPIYPQDLRVLMSTHLLPPFRSSYPLIEYSIPLEYIFPSRTNRLEQDITFDYNYCAHDAAKAIYKAFSIPHIFRGMCKIEGGPILSIYNPIFASIIREFNPMDAARLERPDRRNVLEIYIEWLHEYKKELRYYYDSTDNGDRRTLYEEKIQNQIEILHDNI